MTQSTNRLLSTASYALVVATWLSLSCSACAKPAGTQRPETQPNAAQRIESGSTSQPSDSDRVIPAGNVVTLREHVGETVTVRGRIESTGESKSGIQFLNFESSELTAVCYPRNVARFSEGTPSVLYRHQQVLLTGKVTLYRDKLQIELADPAQIQLVQSPTAALQGVELKQIGTDSWLSPAGLRYQGRDPEGLTRVEHIQRHVRDEPHREGPHGVFDGGSRVAFAVIDQAWKLAEEKKLRPQREGDRSSYTVPMGRRIGFLGGRLGADKRNPPLSKVFIVFRTGSKDIITAFPK